MTPPIEVWRSCIASSIADCVLAELRLISSSSTTLACTGPSWVENVPVVASKTWVPTMSDGSRSGVHWMRLNAPPTASARVCAAVVLARPGTDSTSRWPRPSSVTSSDVRSASWPTTRDRKALDRRSATERACASPSSFAPRDGAGNDIPKA